MRSSERSLKCYPNRTALNSERFARFYKPEAQASVFDRNSFLRSRCGLLCRTVEMIPYRGFGPPGQVAKLRVLRKLNLMEDSTDAHFRFDRMLARQNAC